ncbi:MAG: cation transporting ATPase C-terminal domain-containing protein [Bacilli bacterium]|nr:cation transporting ATPase C-terminal domain-containing protein [Bacilli bacterium]
MSQKPRDSKESLFARGGISLMLGYGTLITINTLLAFFLAPLFNSGVAINSFSDLCNLIGGIIEVYGLNVTAQAQTCAFYVLSLSELFHVLGMTSIRKSFVHNFKTKNKLLWLSFFLGIALQVGVVLIPGINTFFKCGTLNGYHW